MGRRLHDRFIPWLAASLDVPSLSETASPYQKRLHEVMQGRNNVFAYSYPPPPDSPPDRRSPPPPPRRPRGVVHVLDAPDLVKDDYANVLDWGRTALAVALGDRLYLLKTTTDAGASASFTVADVMTARDGKGPIASVAWDADGRRVAVGLLDSDVELWDAARCRLVNSLLGTRHGRVASLHWNGPNLLCSGRANGLVVVHDVRGRGVVGVLRGHRREVCSLRWSACGRELASGGRDKLLCLWDLRMQSYRHRLGGHQAAVKALAWCPNKRHVLASGGGRSIRLWDTTETAAACLTFLDVGGGSRVSGLAWNPNGRELVTSADQLTVWKFPLMMKSDELPYHDSPVLFMAQSPDGCQVATAAADERLVLWDLFDSPQSSPRNRTWKPHGGLFSSFGHIRAQHGRVTSVCWNNHNLTCSGWANSLVIVHDIRECPSSSVVGVQGTLAGSVCSEMVHLQLGNGKQGERQASVYVGFKDSEHVQAGLGNMVKQCRGLLVVPTRAISSVRSNRIWDTETGTCSSSVDVRGSRASGLA